MNGELQAVCTGWIEFHKLRVGSLSRTLPRIFLESNQMTSFGLQSMKSIN